MKPYFEDSRAGIVIYHGDCRDVLPSVCADVLVTDPPYGIAWSRGLNYRVHKPKAVLGSGILYLSD